MVTSCSWNEVYISFRYLSSVVLLARFCVRALTEGSARGIERTGSNVVKKNVRRVARDVNTTVSTLSLSRRHFCVPWSLSVSPCNSLPPTGPRRPSLSKPLLSPVHAGIVSSLSRSKATFPPFFPTDFPPSRFSFRTRPKGIPVFPVYISLSCFILRRQRWIPLLVHLIHPFLTLYPRRFSSSFPPCIGTLSLSLSLT